MLLVPSPKLNSRNESNWRGVVVEVRLLLLLPSIAAFRRSWRNGNMFSCELVKFCAVEMVAGTGSISTSFVGDHWLQNGLIVGFVTDRGVGVTERAVVTVVVMRIVGRVVWGLCVDETVVVVIKGRTVLVVWGLSDDVIRLVVDVITGRNVVVVVWGLAVDVVRFVVDVIRGRNVVVVILGVGRNVTRLGDGVTGVRWWVIITERWVVVNRLNRNYSKSHTNASFVNKFLNFSILLLIGRLSKLWTVPVDCGEWLKSNESSPSLERKTINYWKFSIAIFSLEIQIWVVLALVFV